MYRCLIFVVIIEYFSSNVKKFVFGCFLMVFYVVWLIIGLKNKLKIIRKLWMFFDFIWFLGFVLSEIDCKDFCVKKKKKKNSEKK